jgi:hypothetical protein
MMVARAKDGGAQGVREVFWNAERICKSSRMICARARFWGTWPRAGQARPLNIGVLDFVG